MSSNRLSRLIDPTWIFDKTRFGPDETYQKSKLYVKERNLQGTAIAGYPARQQNGITVLDFPVSSNMIEANPSDGSSTRIKILNLNLSFLNFKCNKFFASLKNN
jgi:hypothetical protein